MGSIRYYKDKKVVNMIAKISINVIKKEDYMNKTYAFSFSESKVKSNSILVIYVPKTNGCKDNIKWFDDNELLKKRR